ncbi:hypothetical protein F9K33_09295 [bacterium]|nr:MAG: hypothetical protein F9K33_09295 [bacterium]
MKTLLTLVIVLSFVSLGSCKHKHSEDESSHKIEPVQLDQGKKWKADQQTNEGVAKLQRLVTVFKTETPRPGIEDYKRLNSQLQTELDLVFKKCTMTGNAHQQLHNFLASVIKELNTLKEDDLKASEHAVLVMEKNLFSYSNFFE